MNSESKPSAGIPADTFQAAHEIYSYQHIYLIIGDRYEDIFSESNLQLLNARFHVGIDSVARLSMVTAFQYVESLPDSIAAEAARKRVDWKYALHLPIHHHGFSTQSLCEFRQDLLASSQAQVEFNHFLEQLTNVGLQTNLTDPFLCTEKILRLVCQITRFHRMSAKMKKALTTLSAYEPLWLVNNMPPFWYGRYKTGPLRQHTTANVQEMEGDAVKLGGDIQFLLSRLRKQNKVQILELPEIRQVEQILAREFSTLEDEISWRPADCGRCESRHMGE